jgi:uncharacterized repeat protein (TIGR03803 family)
MPMRTCLVTAAAIGAAALASFAPAAASGFKDLYDPDYFYGFMNLPVEDGHGNFWGTAGAFQDDPGAIFELQRQSDGGYVMNVLYTFCPGDKCDGEFPVGQLVRDTAGNLYGVTEDISSGAGHIFELTAKGDYQILHAFCSAPKCADGSLPSPDDGLTYAGQRRGAPYDGTSPLYGTTTGGGSANGGVVYEIQSGENGWTETVLYNFCSLSSCADGTGPNGPVLVDSPVRLFGTTALGGNSNDGGTAFELRFANGQWKETVLYDFCSLPQCADGSEPAYANLVRDPAGNLYGVTGAFSNASEPGVLFKLSPGDKGWTETVLHAFCSRKNCTDGDAPAGSLVMDASGNLFGATTIGGHPDSIEGLGAGVVYEYSGSAYSLLHTFCRQTNCPDGGFPAAGVMFDRSARHLIGTTEDGGTGAGVLYRQAP